MSSKVMITYKRKRVSSRRDTTEETVHGSPSAASNNVVTRSLPPKYEVNGEHNVKDEDSFPTSTKQHGVCTSPQQNIEDEAANQSTEKEDKFQSCESLTQKEQPEICCATILSNAETLSTKLQCTDGTNSPVPVSSSVCDPMHIDGMTSRTEDSNPSDLAEINYHQAPGKPISDQCKNICSPLLTFRRRVKKRTSSAEPTEKICSPPDNKQCSTLTCSPQRSSQDATHLLKCTHEETSDIEPKEAIVGISGLPIQAEHSHDEQQSLHNVESSVEHMFPSPIAEAVNQLEHNVTPVSKFNSVLEISEKDARVENLSITTPSTIEVPKVFDVKGEGHASGQNSSLQSLRQEINVSSLKPTNKSVADLLESEGSTKNVPVIVLDDDSDEKSKELENAEVRDQGVLNKNKNGFSLGNIDLNFTELRQEEPPLRRHESSIQWFPDQDQFGNAQKQMSQPVERMFFTKEKYTMHGKQQQHEGSSTIPTLHSTWFDQIPRWNSGNFEVPSMPSELKFRIMDKVPDFSLDLSLDSISNSSVPFRRSNKLCLGGHLGVSHKRTEKLGTYSYKRHPAPWSEEELDFLWIGVRRYGVNNWNAMLRDTRLHFSNSRMPDDLAKQWDKEQKKLLGVGFLQSIRASDLVPAPPLHMADDYLGKSSCSGCSKSLYRAAQTDLSLGDVYLQNAHVPGRGEHQLSSLDMLNLHGIDSASRNLSLGGLPGASSSYGRSSGRRRRASKFYKSHYEKASWFQQSSGRFPHQLFPVVNQQPMNSVLPQWLTKDAETGTSRINPEMWPSMAAPPPGHSAADPLSDVLADDSLKRTMRRNTDWRSFSKRLFQTGDALDLNHQGQGAAAAVAGPNGATASDTGGASSEETVSDS